MNNRHNSIIESVLNCRAEFIEILKNNTDLMNSVIIEYYNVALFYL